MSFDVTISSGDLKDLIPKIKTALSRATELTASEVWGNVKEFSPADHGRLRSSWELKKEGANKYSVSTNVKYALVQNDGSDPYMIYPRRAKALRFEINGRVIFAKSVLHPGIKGTHYIDRAIAKAESRIDDFIYRALSEGGLT